MNCSEFRDMLDRYDSLNELEMKVFEKHSETCEECRQELDFYRSIISVTASLPIPKQPDNLAELVNKRIDSEPRFIKVCHSIVFELKNNTRRYATFAACIALGLVVGLNQGYISDRLKTPDDSGVISEKTEASQTETPVISPKQEIKRDKEVTPVPIAEKPSETKAPERKTTEQLKKEALEGISQPTQKPQPSATPSDKKTDTNTKNTQAVKQNSTTKSVEVTQPPKEAIKPTADIVTEPTTAPTNPAVSESETASNVSKLPSGRYELPDETEPEEAVTSPKANVGDYEIYMGTGEVAYAYDDEPQAESLKQYRMIAGYDKLSIENENIGTVKSLMEDYGVAYKDDHYEMSYDAFASFLSALKEANIDYDYVQLYDGENVAFKIMSR